MEPLAKTTFGVGDSHEFLVDTLNKLDKRSVAAKCMAMISASRGWCYRMTAVWQAGALSAKELATIVRLYRTEQGSSFKKLNAELDERLKAWEHELTDQGYIDMELEHLALKLAMNIAAAPVKDLICRLQKTRAVEISNQSKVRHLRSKCDIDTVRLGLPIEKEIALLKELTHEVR